MTMLEFTGIAISLIGGLAIFLYGMKVMTESLTLVACRHNTLCELGQRTVEALVEDNLEKAASVNNSKASFNQLMEQTRQHLARRLTIDTPQHMATYRLENHVIESFKHIHSLYRRIAKLILAEQPPLAPEHEQPAEATESAREENTEK